MWRLTDLLEADGAHFEREHAVEAGGVVRHEDLRPAARRLAVVADVHEEGVCGREAAQNLVQREVDGGHREVRVQLPHSLRRHLEMCTFQSLFSGCVLRTQQSGVSRLHEDHAQDVFNKASPQFSASGKSICPS